MCAIIGYVRGERHDLEPLRKLLYQSKIRGLHSFGYYVKYADGSVDQRKYTDIAAGLDLLSSEIVAGIFHFRYSTSGDFREPRNNQPIYWGHKGLIFNGVVSMKTKAEMEAEYKIEMDTENDGEIVLKLHSDSKETFKRFLETHPGSFAGAIMTPSRIIFGRNERRPAWQAMKRHGIYFASTFDILDRAGFRLEEPGDVLETLTPGHVYEWMI